MKFLASIILFAAISTAYAAPAESATTPEDRVLGGSDAPEGAYPYQVSVRRSTGHFCGGSILSTRYILSAAHCFEAATEEEEEEELFRSESEEMPWIIVGSIFLSKGGNRYNLEFIVNHPQYNTKTIVNDIALLKTTENIIFKDTVQPIEIYQQEVPTGAILTLTGYGFTTWPVEKLPDKLQEIRLKKIDYDDCEKHMIYYYRELLIKSQICTESPAKQGACMGDSGGPLVYNGSLVGIVSWGVPCGTAYPDVFTKVLDYIKWIKKNME